MKLPKNVPTKLLIAGLFAFVASAPVHAGPEETEAAQQALEDAGLDDGVTVRVDDDGVATLSGMVDESGLGNRARSVVSDVPGVNRVVDMLRTDD